MGVVMYSVDGDVAVSVVNRGWNTSGTRSPS
ncbi:MAG: hypothetical protein HMLKMBBP_02630 [Planctomycetes bacterium]|nr:hypothetical protein [Planctomycetota bacterium]